MLRRAGPPTHQSQRRAQVESGRHPGLLIFCVKKKKKLLWTYQDAVESRRGPSSLHVTQDCHSRVETQALDDKLGGHDEALEDIVGM